jgi:signal transduction histidine kinase
LSAGVAHEILNPLNIISLELQLIQEMKHLPRDVSEELNICMAQIDRIVAIADGLMQLARVSDKKMEKAQINDLIAGILTLHKAQLMIDKIETIVRYQDGLPEILMDQKKIEQVLLNLISNARGAMEGRENKILRIATDREGKDAVRITVADTGRGIATEHLSKLFNPFFTTKAQGKGTGLGLSISYGIIKDHGGRIWAENNSWGGSSFYISLPVHRTTSGQGP